MHILAERRESPRIPIQLGARQPGEARFEPHQGDVSLGGARVEMSYPPFAEEIEVELPLPDGPLRLVGDVVRVSGGGLAYNAHLRFRDVPLDGELSIARYLEAELRRLDGPRAR